MAVRRADAITRDYDIKATCLYVLGALYVLSLGDHLEFLFSQVVDHPSLPQSLAKTQQHPTHPQEQDTNGRQDRVAPAYSKTLV